MQNVLRNWRRRAGQRNRDSRGTRTSSVHKYREVCVSNVLLCSRLTSSTPVRLLTDSTPDPSLELENQAMQEMRIRCDRQLVWEIQHSLALVTDLLGQNMIIQESQKCESLAPSKTSLSFLSWLVAFTLPLFLIEFSWLARSVITLRRCEPPIQQQDPEALAMNRPSLRGASPSSE